jgi:hypothetical protein
LGYLILLGVFVLILVLSIVFKTKLIGAIRNIIVKFIQVKED